MIFLTWFLVIFQPSCLILIKQMFLMISSFSPIPLKSSFLLGYLFKKIKLTIPPGSKQLTSNDATFDVVQNRGHFLRKRYNSAKGIQNIYKKKMQLIGLRNHNFKPSKELFLPNLTARNINKKNEKM